MDKLQAMQVFVQVVELNGFARAADKLGLPRASVTTIIQNLEAHLGTSLLLRTTRRLSLTADGELFHERALRILAEVEEVETGFIEGRRHPKGRLHVDMPTSIGRLVVIPHLREFHERYPDIDLKLGMNDRQIDIVQEGVDCVLRVGDLADSSMIARRLGLLSRITCASPAYLEKHGVPQSLEDLAHHQGVRYFSPHLGNRSYPFEFMQDGVEVDIALNGAIAVNDSEAYIACGVQGYGLMQPGLFMVLEQFQRGELVEVLPEFRPRPMPISAVYPPNRQPSQKVRLFVDWVVSLFEQCPILQGADKPFACYQHVAA